MATQALSAHPPNSSGGGSAPNGTIGTSGGWKALLSSPARLVNSTSVVVFTAACVILLVAIIAFIVWRIRRSDLKTTRLVKTPLRMYGTGVPLTIEKSKIPPTLNGQEYTYSFWLYLVQYNSASSPIVLFGRGIQTAGNGGSPVVYLDQDTNKMYISVATNTATQSSTPLSTIVANLPTGGGYDSVTGYVTSIVDYVPLQRWVNVAVSVQDYLMTVYVDGDMYAVQNITEGGVAGAKRPVFGATAGDVTVGSAVPANQAQAFLSQLQVFNYALTHSEVKLMYEGGPVAPSALSMLGIPEYGIRSPVYKIDG